MLIITKFLWAVGGALIIMIGIYFTFTLKFIQFNFKKMFKNLKEKNNNKNEISLFKSLMLSLGGRLGIGSIAGVALAIHIGGVGSIFWIWVICLISGANTFSENLLANVYKKKDDKNLNKGGPSYYLKQGLGYNKLGSLYAVLIILGYTIGISAIQSNTISSSLNIIFPSEPILIGLILAAITGFIIFGGISKISKIINTIVPFMSITYILCFLHVIFKNYNQVIDIVILIIKEAMQFKPFFSGFLFTMIVGIQRGIFSSESGVGTSAIVSATTKDINPTKQGFVQILGIYVTLLICSATTFVILTSDYELMNFNNINGIEITQYAFKYHFGNIGNYIMFTIIFLFSFSTIITVYYYGESSLKFLKNKLSLKNITFLKVISILVVFIGSIMPPSILWEIVDLLLALLVIINMSACFCLRKVVKKELEFYK